MISPRPLLLRLHLLVACWLLLPAVAFAQEYANCPGHLFAIGSRLGWAEALARNAGPEQDAAMFAHIRAVAAHAAQANAQCAQTPPPWPVFTNWRQMQSSLEQIINEYQRGLINRGQLAQRLGAGKDALAGQLAFRVLGPNVYHDRTCGELYIRIGSALAFAQTTTQINRRLVPDARNHLREARALIEQAAGLQPQCRNMTALLPAIDEAVRHEWDDSTVPRVNDLWLGAARATQFGAPPQPTPPTPPGGNIQNCGFHLWATGSRLGWAEALARYGVPATDEVMFQHIAAAGLHAERANATCAQQPPPWPAWQNWREIQARLNQMAEAYRRGLTSRLQLATSLAGLQDALASQLMWRVLGEQVERDRTCGELYVRIGAALGYAQTTTQLHRRIIPDAAEHLRQARNLIQLAGQLRPPCTSLESLLQLIDQTLYQSSDPRSVAWVDEIWRQGAIIMRPSDPSWQPPPPSQPPPTPPLPSSGGQSVVVSGGLDRATVDRHVNHILNDLRFQQASYTANQVTLEIVAPTVPGQPYIARITGQVQFERHLLHPPRNGPNFEEWWHVTVTLGEGQGTLDRLEGPASAVEEYRSLAPDRVTRNNYPNLRWHALRQPDGSYRLTMPGISDGVPFTLVPR